jgi:ArsR family transcriptional regulator
MEVSQRQVEMCAALGDVNRLLLLYALVDEPKSVGELAQRVGLPQPSVSHHLRILRESGVVDTERRGKLIYYFPVDPRIFEVLDILRAISIRQMQRQGDAAQSAAPRPAL